MRGVNACSVSRPAFPFLSRRTSSDVSLLFVVEQATCSSSTYITYRRRRRFNFAAVAHSAKSTARASFTQRNFPEFLRILAILTPPPIGERSTVMIVYVCVFVCPRASYFRNFISDLKQIFVHVTYGRGSVFRWRRSDMLCTSGLWMASYLLVSQGCSTSPPS